MRLKIGKTEQAREFRLQWHKWFAWYPIYIVPNLIWLSKVERRSCCGGYCGYNDYREIKDEV